MRFAFILDAVILFLHIRTFIVEKLMNSVTRKSMSRKKKVRFF